MTADRTPGAEVHVGKSLVHDRRLVPGSPMQLGKGFAEDETAEDGVKVGGLHDHGHDVRGRIGSRAVHRLTSAGACPAGENGAALATVLAVIPGTASNRAFSCS